MNYTDRGLRRRNGDKWEVVFTYTDPLTGEKQPSYHTVKAKTEAAAKKARNVLRFELESKGVTPTSKTTVQNHLDSYLARREKTGTVEISTICGYQTLSKMLVRYIGGKRISELSISDIDNLMIRMTDDDYSSATCGKVFRLLKMALKDAVAQDLIKKNPCDYASPPKRPKTKVKALNQDERRRMLELTRGALGLGSPLSVAIELALATGMRRSEICALRWSDIDENGIIHVRRSLGANNGTFYVKDTKTPSSTREIPLAESAFDYLKAYRDMLKRIYSSLEVPFGDQYILSKSQTGIKPYNPTLLSKEFTMFANLNGFDCTFHDLRHTFATYMVAAKVDIATVASYLGHSNISVTLNTYTTADPNAKRAAAEVIENEVGYGALRN